MKQRVSVGIETKKQTNKQCFIKERKNSVFHKNNASSRNVKSVRLKKKTDINRSGSTAESRPLNINRSGSATESRLLRMSLHWVGFSNKRAINGHNLSGTKKISLKELKNYVFYDETACFTSYRNLACTSYRKRKQHKSSAYRNIKQLGTSDSHSCAPRYEKQCLLTLYTGSTKD